VRIDPFADVVTVDVDYGSIFRNANDQSLDENFIKKLVSWGWLTKNENAAGR
jgi:hypothetical protein